jgi:Family of unknown function (DUF5412)
MCSRTKVALWGVALSALAVLAVGLFYYARSLAVFSGCENDVLAESTSPDGAYVATVFERNCGATTPYYRVVSLRPRTSGFDPEEKGAWVFEVRNRPEVKVAWTGARQLSIMHSSVGEITLELDHWKDVEIDRP